MSRTADERHYVRAVEAAWSRLQGRPVVVSPREFEAIESWRRRGIPLAIVLEAIAATGTRRSSRAPRSLTALSHAVAEAWDVVAAGRAPRSSGEALAPRADARHAWEEAHSRTPERTRLRSLLETLLADEARGTTPEALDAALDASLPGAVSQDTLKRATEDTASALASFRDRMSADEFQKLFARALADRLRSTLRLPRLVLTR